MIMSNTQMEASIKVLETLHEHNLLGYAIARNLRILKEQTTEFRQCREATIREYGVATPGANGLTEIKVPPENMQTYLSEMLPISAIEHDVEVFKIDPETFFNGGLDSKQMEQLMWMVEDN